MDWSPYTFDLVQNFGKQQMFLLFADPVGNP